MQELLSHFKKPAVLIALASLIIIIAIESIMIYFLYQREPHIDIDGKSYTLFDLKTIDAPLFHKTITERNSVTTDALSRFAGEKVLSLEAKNRGITEEALIQEAVSNFNGISDEEMENIYNMYKDRFAGMNKAEAFQMIQDRLSEQKKDQLVQGIRNQLNDKFQVKVHSPSYDAPRVTVSEDGNPAWGEEPSKAKITVVEYSDFECPFCERSQETNKRLRDKYKGQIRWVFKDYPLPFHKNAMKAHISANCAVQQNKYWDYFNLVFQNTKDLSESRLEQIAAQTGLDVAKWKECTKDKDGSMQREIQKDIISGQKLGVNGTPAFFINGIFVSGAQPFEAFDEIISKEIKN
jgi:protein-disulfide isomerase